MGFQQCLLLFTFKQKLIKMKMWQFPIIFQWQKRNTIKLSYSGPQITPGWEATAFSISDGEWCKNNKNGQSKQKIPFLAGVLKFLEFLWISKWTVIMKVSIKWEGMKSLTWITKKQKSTFPCWNNPLFSQFCFISVGLNSPYV